MCIVQSGGEGMSLAQGHRSALGPQPPQKKLEQLLYSLPELYPTGSSLNFQAR